MIKQCLVCGKDFVTYPSKIKLGRGKYCSKECCLSVTNKILEENGKKTRWKKGQMPKQYKGWHYINGKDGKPKYIVIYKPDHPYATKRKTVREHRLVMEKMIGRYLQPDEVVHHIDENGLNNDPSNLMLLTKREHDRMNVNLNIHRRWL